jgi:hypothetical protein
MEDTSQYSVIYFCTPPSRIKVTNAGGISVLLNTLVINRQHIRLELGHIRPNDLHGDVEFK